MNTCEPVSCVKVSSAEAKASMKSTTEAELAKLAQTLKNQKPIEREDHILSDDENDDSNCDSDSSEEDYIPEKKYKRKSKHQSVEIKMYNDNQDLWRKIHKYSIELNKTQKQLNYLQLENNNKNIEIIEFKSKMQKNDIIYSENKLLKLKYVVVFWAMILSTFLNIVLLIDYQSEHVFFHYVGLHLKEV